MKKTCLYGRLEQVRKSMNVLWEIKSLVDEKFLSVSAEFDDLMNQYNKIAHSDKNNTPGA